MKRALLALLFICGCGVGDPIIEMYDADTDTLRIIDANYPRDSGVHRDVRELSDADPPLRDAGTDANSPHDAGPPPVCDLVTQEGCSRAMACKRSHVDGGPSNLRTGPPECTYAGSLVEDQGPCRELVGSERRDLCAPGYFCATWDGCVRYCDPDGVPCPNWRGHPAIPQRCRVDPDSNAGIPHCTTEGV